MILRSKSLIATPPGYAIKEQLEDRRFTQKEFALRMDMSEKHISKLINGEVLLTTDMALRLEMVLGIPAQFWLNLEAIYREKIAKIELENNMQQDAEIASHFPYHQMVALGWVNQASTKIERVINLRKFFEVSRLGLLFENNKINVLYRRIEANEKANYALMVWAQRVRVLSRDCVTSSLNIAGLKKYIPVFRRMTKQTPDTFKEELKEIMAKNGVALVFLPHLKSTYLHGATFYDGNRVVMGLTIRGKEADRFWFSFFHELGHIILGHIDYEYDKNMEKEADDFAEESLIPLKEYERFLTKRDFSKKSIIEFAEQIDIDVGVVVGRLQWKKYIQYNQFTELKKTYDLEN